MQHTDCVSLPSPRPRPWSQWQDGAQTQKKLLLRSHHDAHIGQSELSAELASVEGTDVLNSGKRGDGYGLAYWEDWKTVSEASINPFLLEERQFKGLICVIYANPSMLLFWCTCKTIPALRNTIFDISCLGFAVFRLNCFWHVEKNYNCIIFWIIAQLFESQLNE